jgi:hypothetical protein
VTTVVLVGNGLSIGFDARLSGRSITERVTAAIDDDLRTLLDRVVHLGQPESPDQPIGADRGAFEQLAGPLDRLAEALIAVQDLLAVAGDSEAVRGLGDASQELRRQYFRIVGTVLREVDACCIEPQPDDARRAAWQRLNDFAAQLVDWNGAQNKVTVFTLNYDSLLLSSMLEASEWVYDGFRGLTLNHPLDRWSNPALYHLHGSVSWIRGREGIVSKKRLDVMRLENILDRWAEGDVAVGQPSVVLTDLKTPEAARYPFALMYEELARSLSVAGLAVVAGTALATGR